MPPKKPPAEKFAPSKYGGGKVKPAKNGVKMDGKERQPNAWVQFVSEYALNNGITYSCALGDHYAELSAEYRKEAKALKIPVGKKVTKGKKSVKVEPMV